MAMFEICGPTPSELREAFDRAAQGGWRYLLRVATTFDDPDLVMTFETTDCVTNELDILTQLKEKHIATRYADTRLAGVFDLTRDYDAQAAVPGEQQIKNILSPAAQAGLMTLDKEMKREQAQRAWAARPFYERLFVSKPA